MNKRDFNNVQRAGESLAIIYNSIGKCELPREIYVVKLNEVHYAPTYGATKKNSSLLHGFQDLEIAKQYVNLIHTTLISPIITNEYKVTLDVIKENTELKDANSVLERTTRLIGNLESNYNHSKLFIFTIDKISYIATK